MKSKSSISICIAQPLSPFLACFFLAVAGLGNLKAQYITNVLDGEREFVESYWVGFAESLPRDLTFSDDGSKMFVLGINDDAIAEFNLSLPFDISTATYAGSIEDFFVGGEEASAEGFVFKPDGSRCYVVGVLSDAVIQYDLGTPYDVSTAIYSGASEELDISSQISAAKDLAFNHNGTRLFVVGSSSDKVVQYNLSTPYDVSTGSYAGSAFDLDIKAEEEDPSGMAFDQGGSHLYVIGKTNASVIKYNLSGAYQVSTGVYAGAGQEFYVGDRESAPMDVVFAQRGNKMFIIGTIEDEVMDFTVVNHLTYTENDLAAIIDIDAQREQGDVQTYPIDQQVTYSLTGVDASHFSITTDGIINFVNPPDFENRLDEDQDNEYFITLVVENDITGEQDYRAFNIEVKNVDDTPILGSFEGGFEFGLATYEGIASSFYFGDYLDRPRDMTFSEDGLNLYILDNEVDSIYQFHLTYPYHIQSASYSGNRVYVSDVLTEPSGFIFTPDGSKLIVSGESSTDKKIYEYHLSTSYDVSTAAYAGEGESLDASGTSFSGGGVGTMRFSDDGMNLYVIRLAFLLIEEYYLTVPYDISTGVESNIWIQATEFDHEPSDVAFSDDGLLFWKLHDGLSSLIRYELTAPFDLTTLDYVGPNGSNNNDQFINLTDPEPAPISFTFNSGGTRCFVLGTADDRIYQYELPANLKVGENEFFVFDVDAQDGMGGATDTSVTYSLSGTDADDFIVNANGEINFVSPPDFENPADDGTNNSYEVTLTADNGLNSTNQRLIVTVIDKTDEVPPVITSANEFSLAENTVGLLFFALANEMVTFTLGNSKDEQFFTIADGEVLALSHFDFENPEDANMDNLYMIDLIADDGENEVTQEVTITVTDMAETFVDACDSHDWEGNTYTSPGTYLNTFTDSMGQDSVAALHLTLLDDDVTVAIEACDSYEFDGNTLTITGQYPGMFTNVHGCDSLVTLNLTILESTTSEEAVEACESYDWNGTTYETSGTYMGMFTNKVGCDSTATLNLTILEPTSSSEETTACGSYEWNGNTYTTSDTYIEMFTNAAGCDSTATLELTIVEATQTFNESVSALIPYTFGTQTLTSSGDYTEQFQSIHGCDSIVNLTFTALSPCDFALSIPNNESIILDTLQVDASDGADFFEFTVPADGFISFSACEAPSGGGNDDFLRIYEGDCSNLISSETGNLSCVRNAQWESPVIAGTTYFFEWNIDYTMGSQDSDVFSPIFFYQENYEGYDCASASEIQCDGPFEVEARRVVQWHEWTAPSSRTYVLGLPDDHNQPVGTGGVPVYFEVKESCGATYLSNNDPEDEFFFKETLTFEATEGNSYFFTIQNYGYQVEGNNPLIMEIEPDVPIEHETSVSACSSYEFDGSTLTTSGNYTATFSNHLDCDSLVSLNLTILAATSSSEDVEACDSYTWNGVDYATSGTYQELFTNAAGCDSTATLNLTILEATSGSENVEACDNYTWNGVNYTISGTYQELFTNVAGCDSIATLNLTILEATSSSEDVEVCDSYSWNGVDYTISGTYQELFTNVAGCDSTATLNLTILEATSSSEHVEACESYTWNGVDYTTSGTYQELFTNVVGCDSTATLNLTILESTTSEETVESCESYDWNGMTYSASGTYQKLFTNAAGCDSLATLSLTISEASDETVAVEACQSYEFDGNLITTSGQYNATFQRVNGCDSLVTLNLTILEATSNEETVESCENYDWNGVTYDTTGTYQELFTNASGCDSTATLNLTILEGTSGSEDVEACDNYFWNGVDYTISGTYQELFTNAAGCDSTATLNLTIVDAYNETIEETSCGAYEFDSQTIVTSGTYNAVFTAQNGCDSLVTLTLTVQDEPESTVEVNGVILFATEIEGASYRWCDCDSNEALVGETKRQLTPPKTGEYAVEVTIGECSSISACTFFDWTLAAKEELSQEVKVYPSVTSGTFTLNLNSSFKEVNVRILSIDGNVHYSKDYETFDREELELKGSQGIYLVQVSIEGEVISTDRIIKK